MYDFTSCVVKLHPEGSSEVGNEERGCSREALKLADYLVENLLRGRKNSLNVVNAFAMTASEISR